jgi:subtilisin family serine protease
MRRNLDTFDTFNHMRSKSMSDRKRMILLASAVLFVCGIVTMLHAQKPHSTFRRAAALPAKVSAEPIMVEVANPSGSAITFTYSLPDAKIKATGVQYEGVKLSEVDVGNALQSSNEGEPVLPVVPVQVVIPNGFSLENFKVVATKVKEVSGTYRIRHGEAKIPLVPGAKRRKAMPLSRIYGSDNTYPSQTVELVGVQYKRGIAIAVLKIHPVAYRPKSGKITAYTSISVELKTKKEGSHSLLKSRPNSLTGTSLQVENPEALGSYDDGSTAPLDGDSVSPLGICDPAQSYRYVLVTADSIRTATTDYTVRDLIAQKQARGLSATIVTIENVLTNYTGADNAERLRNFVIDAYNNWETDFVLLGGDINIIPMRKLYCYAGGETDQIPSDLYYQCLDGNYNSDNDAYWGEPTDGPGGTDVDLMAEVYIGRASAETKAEMSNFVFKTLAYENAAESSPYLRKAIMVGEYLGFGGVSEYATATMEEIRLGSSASGYTTAGFASSPLFLVDTLYDRSGYSWPASEILSRMSGGTYGIYNHLGHANATYVMKFYNADADALTNNNFFFAYSQGCIPGNFEVDCIAEHLTTSTRHGAFAVVFNARYGWGQYNSTDGPSQRFDRQFWDAYFGEFMSNLGALNADSHEDNIWDINGDCIRWCFYETNLFGDPQTPVRGRVVGPSLSYSSHTISDAAGGNGDGLVNPGETVDITLTVANVGTDSAAGVIGTVTSTDPYVTVVNGGTTFGTVQCCGATRTAAGPVRLTVSSGCPTPRAITLSCLLRDSRDSTWTSTFTITSYTSSQVSGYVRTLTGGNPISGATVSFTGPISGSVTTDASGAYMFGGINGTYSVSASAAGYTPSSAQSVAIPPSLTDINFALGRARIAVTPSGINRTVIIGDSTQVSLNVQNTGDLPLYLSATADETALGTWAPAAIRYDSAHFILLDKGTTDTRQGEPQVLTRGGPDSAGYRWVDSREAGGPAYVWNDIASTGRLLTSVSGCDDCYESVTLTFPFSFYGNTFTSCYVSSNGYLTFGAASSQYSNYALPSTSMPANLIAGFFDDLYPSSAGDIYFQDFGDRAIVQFNGVSIGSSTTYLCTFQMVLNRSGVINLYYKRITGSQTGCTVGIQNNARTVGLNVVYNASYLGDSLAVEIRSRPAWISVAPTRDTVSPGQTEQLTVKLNSSGLNGGMQTGAIQIAHNSPLTSSPLSVPCTLVVDGMRRLAITPQTVDFGPCWLGLSDTAILTLSNSGDEPTTVSLVTSTNAYFSAITALPLTVPAFGNTMLRVKYQPGALGSHSGILTVNSNAEDNPSIAITCNGSGTNPPSISVTPLSFKENLLSGDSVSRDLVVHNPGGATLSYSITNQSGGAGGDSLKAYWRFDEGSGTTIYDASPYANTGTITGAAWGTGYINAGLSFDGDDDNVTMTSNGSLNITRSITLSAWVKPNTIAKEWQRVLCKDNQTTSSAYNLGISTNGGVYFALFQGSTQYYISGTAQLQTGVWNHIAGTWDGTTMRIYLNGVLQSQTLTFTGTINVTSDPVRIGRATTSLYALNGSVDEARIYSRGLSGDEITALYNNQAAGWLSVSRLQGTVAPAGRDTVQVRFSSRDLLGGNYRGLLSLAHNAPATPSPIALPCSLSVDGFRRLSASPSSLNFGSLWVGMRDTMYLTLTNGGNEATQVTSITSNHTAFSVLGSLPLTVPPFDTVVVPVVYQPGSVGNHSGTLTVNSNAEDNPHIDVAMAGTGIPSPQIATSPSSFHVSVNSGDSMSQILTINNTGGDSLSFNTSVLFNQTMASQLQLPLGPMDKKEYFSQSGNAVACTFEKNPQIADSIPVAVFGNSNQSTLASFLQSAGFKAQVITETNILSGVLSNYRVLVMVHNTATLASGVAQAIETFTAGGGSLVTEWSSSTLLFSAVGTNPYYVQTPQWAWFQGTIGNGNSVASSTPISITDVNNTLAAGLSNPFSGGGATEFFYTVSGYSSDLSVVAVYSGWGGTWPALMIGRHGGGNVIIHLFDSGDDLSYASIQRLWINSIQTAYSGSGAWLRVAPTSGKIAAGNSMNINLAFSSGSMVGGTYQGVLNILHNAPGTVSPIAVPCTLSVDGFRRLAASPSSLDFGSLWVGLRDTLAISLSNGGNEATTVSSVSSTNPYFTAITALPLTVPAFGNTTLRVLYQPGTVGNHSGTMTVNSNAEDNPVIGVSYTGIGVDPPQIAVTPSAITRTVLIGDSAQDLLSVQNTGGSPLVISSSAEETSLGVWAPASIRYDSSHFIPLNKGTTDTRQGEPQVLTRGGPDSAGYRWMDSREAGGPAYVWNDIASTGRVLSTVSGCDDCYESVTLSFPFSFYGNTFTSCYVSSNGYLTFGTASSQYSNYALPSTSMPANLIAGFFDDLYPTTAGDIYFQDFGDRAIVQFNGVSIGSSTTYLCTFQMVLNRNGAINLYYKRITGSQTGCTVGIQNNARTVGLNIVYNASYLGDSLAVEIRSRPKWISVSPSWDTVNPGQTEQLTVKLTSSGLNGGVQAGVVRIAHNAPQTSSPLSVPCTLVIDGMRRLSINPLTVDFGPCWLGLSETAILTLTNSGDEATTVSSVSSTDPYFTTITSLPLTVPAFGNTTLRAVYQPGTIGSHNGTLTVNSNAEDNPSITVACSGTGFTPPSASVRPDSLYYSLQPSELPDTQVCYVHNTGGDTLRYSIQGINQVSGPSLTVEEPTHSLPSIRNDLIYSSDNEKNPFVNGRIIVGMALTFSSPDESLLKKIGAVKTRELGIARNPKTGLPVNTGRRAYCITLSDTTADGVLNAIGQLRNEPSVAYAEPDYLLHTSVVPNDPYFSQLYGMQNTGQTGGTNDADIDATDVWERHTGNRSILIGVIDTGIDYLHPDLAANIWTNPGEIPGNGIDDDHNGFIDDIHGWDFAYDDNNPMDGHYHGTHCAGTIAGIGNNGVGVAGVMWTASLVAIKFLDDGGSGTTSDAIDAVNYATAMGVKITSNSWGGGAFSQALMDAISAGGLFVAAAGNSASNNDVSPQYPASYALDNILSVAATDHNDLLASFSCYGRTSVDLGAPGVNIYSCAPGSSYQTLSGTSMATPHVSGSAGLLWSYNPSLTALQVKQLLMDNVDPVSSLSGRTVTGGRLNINSALQAAGPAWLTASPMAGGSVAPGDSAAISVIVTPSGLAAGRWEGEVVVATNDPLHRQLTIDVVADIAAQRSLAAFPSSLNFGSLWVGLRDTLALQLVNRGNAATLISSIAVSNPAFISLMSAPIMVPAFDSVMVRVVFIPGSQGSYSGAMTVTSDAQDNPVLSIALTGFATLPPSIAVTPDRLSVALEPDQSAQRNIVIQNSGGDQLDYSLQAIGQGGNGDTIDILAWTPYTDMTGEWVNMQNALRQYLSRYTVATSTTFDSTVLESALASKEVFLIPEQESGSIPSGTGTRFRGVLVRFLQRGGTIICCSPGFGASHTFLSEAQLISLTLISYSSSGAITLTRPDDSLFYGISGTLNMMNATTYCQVNDNATVLGTYSGYMVVAKKSLYSGRVITLGPDFYAYDSNWARILCNAVLTAKPAASWLSLSSQGGSVLPGGQHVIIVTVSSARLDTGTYSAAISVGHNDPMYPSPIHIPVTLWVGEIIPGLTGNILSIGVSAAPATYGSYFRIKNLRIGSPVAGQAQGSRYKAVLQ